MQKRTSRRKMWTTALVVKTWDAGSMIALIFLEKVILFPFSNLNLTPYGLSVGALTQLIFMNISSTNQVL